MAERSESVLGELLCRAQTGAESARNALFARCRSLLLGVARAFAHRLPEARLDASDLVQQTLLDAYRAFRHFRGTSPKELLAWLRQILENRITDAARRWVLARKRSPKREIPLVSASDSGQLGWDPACEITPSADKVANWERDDLLQRALAQLPELYRQVIVWRHFEGVPFAEIAQRLSRSRPAAQMLWVRAIKRLRTLLQGSPLDEDFHSRV
ncbi:MAG: sigma-70 family RNA polymerase sigma factor [Gemmatales bacterium]|nr:sigma-70 family RNA polymerase sigma factor [Gemmatales bacterium]MDW7995420.1 sigma-70 family RNA polymerase sigma factor [Gemmatales bacterium]